MIINPLDNLIGLNCIESRSTILNIVVFEFSRFPDKFTLLLEDFDQVEYTMIFTAMAWRMTSTIEFKTGSYESTEYKDNGLKEFIGSRLVKIQYNTPTDLVFFFDNGYQIETFKHSSENGLMELFSFEQGEKEPTVIQMEASGDWSVAEDISFTKDEKEFYKHSEDTDSRWQLLLPADDSDTPCSKCANYLPVRGQFHFWNYGLCSNEDSVYDGRAVGANCTCAYFSDKLII
jgi:hypothetical protein